MQKTLNFKTNYFFPPMARYLGYLITLIGLIGISTSGIQTLFISLIGLGISFTRYGVLIDVENRRLKQYNSVFWIKFGNWELLDYYPYVTVLEITERQSMYSRAQVEQSSRDLVFRVTLLNDNHYKKVLLKQLNYRELAHLEAEKVALAIGVEKVIYSPG
ncbi:MAG TPA: hypothetical protein PLZ00_05155 [Mangrovimonas sp.]|nr:hypothetical protein [Mangrovimonas sp.]